MGVFGINAVGCQCIGVTASFYGAFGATYTVSFELNKIGNMVYFSTNDTSLIVITGASAGATNTIVADNVLPDGFKPAGATIIFFPTTVISNSVEESGYFAVTDTGSIAAIRDINSTDFATTNDNGFVPPAAFWRA